MSQGDLQHQPAPVAASAIGARQLRYFDFVMAAFVAIILLSNVIGAGKVAVIHLPWIGDWPFGAGILFFPLSYVIGDVLTEVYGYARARRVIWAGTVAARNNGIFIERPLDDWRARRESNPRPRR